MNLAARTEYLYDALGRVIQVKLPRSGVHAVSPMLTFEYDAMNRVTREIDPLGRETSYVYDAMGRLIEPPAQPIRSAT